VNVTPCTIPIVRGPEAYGRKPYWGEAELFHVRRSLDTRPISAWLSSTMIAVASFRVSHLECTRKRRCGG
jgi:hypothetical protein